MQSLDRITYSQRARHDGNARGTALPFHGFGHCLAGFHIKYHVFDVGNRISTCNRGLISINVR